jgi:hypothetical protein
MLLKVAVSGVSAAWTGSFGRIVLWASEVAMMILSPGFSRPQASAVAWSVRLKRAKN